MKLRDSAHFAQPWRIHDLTRDFRLEDVWALPTPGARDDFPRVIDMIASFNEADRQFSLVGLLFAVRKALGHALGWDGPTADSRRPGVAKRLPDDLRQHPSTVTPAMGFTPLYQLDDEWAAELINRTVHGVIHLGWVPDGDGGYRGQMAILVKPNGVLGRAYMAAITPFRYAIVYPQMLKKIGREWATACAPR
ncbi:MAG TPA: DUF2867 domain-containing protein [Mycobacterium sp.]|nr:DUF2867 domain-containing protein [Mycobacterium sp.]